MAQPALAQLSEKIVYPQFYTYHTGDSAERDWAQPDFDDSDWKQAEIHTFPLDDWQGIGWFRYVFEVDSALWDVPLGFQMQYAGAAEVYLNGVLLHRFGQVGASKEDEKGYHDLLPIPREISFRSPVRAGSGKSRRLIAVRYSSFLLVSMGSSPFLDFYITDLHQAIAWRDNFRNKVTVHQMFLMGVFLAFALLHALLFFYYPKERANLYYAALSSFQALAIYSWFQIYFTTDPMYSALILSLRDISMTFSMLAAIRLTYLFIYPKRPMILLYFFFVGVGLTLWSLARPFTVGMYTIVFSIVAFLEIVRVLAMAGIKKRVVSRYSGKGSWIILLGMLPMAITGAYWLLEYLNVAPELLDFTDFPVPFYAVLLLMISMSIFLARNFAQTSKNLEARLVEVQVLSEKTLQQKLEQARLEQELELEHLQAEKLQEIDRMKSRFFANISHELRTPLTLILGPLEKLLSEKFPELAKKQFRLMLRNGRRLLRLINQLLDLAKLEAGSMALKARPENIVQLLKGIVLSFSSLAESKKISLDFRAHEEEIIAYVDRDMLEKIVSNLLSNGFKFTPEGGAVSVECGVRNSELKRDDHSAFRTPNSEFVEIRISDTGLGIPVEKLSHIFDRFYQADDSYTKDQEGSGIGLALTKELVELHHGEIRVTSEPGKGSTFIVRLPLGKEHLKPEEIVEEVISDRYSVIGDQYSEVSDQQPTTNNEHRTTSIQQQATSDQSKRRGDPDSLGQPILLIIEDNTDVRTYIRDELEKDYEILEAVDGEDGFEKSVEAIPDLIISDVMMPKTDGYQLCKKLKTDERTSHIPVILLTARAGGESKIEGLETGADDYIIKPFDARELQVRVKNLIEQRRRLRERCRKEMILEPKEITITSMDEQFLQRAMEVIERNLSDPEFSTENFARQVAMSRAQLHRKLHALTGQSTHEFIRTYRLKRAAQFLQHQAGTVSEICYDVGFNSLSHFSKAFREMFGQSPSEFAASHVPEES